MTNAIQTKNIILSTRNSYQRSLWRGGFALTGLALAWLTLAPRVWAQCPQICDINANTALGIGALVNTTGFANTGIGADALFSNTTASNNTASGFNALVFNTIGIGNTANGVGVLSSNNTGSNNTASGYLAL